MAKKKLSTGRDPSQILVCVINNGRKITIEINGNGEMRWEKYKAQML